MIGNVIGRKPRPSYLLMVASLSLSPQLLAFELAIG
jgi:hypothetical protein